MKPLEGRVAIVTGASAGIGEAVARSLANAGARVVINARRVERLESLRGAIETSGGKAAVCAGDASDADVVERLFTTADEAFGSSADLVVVNAGRGLSGSVLTSDPAQWDEMVRVNVLGAAHLMRRASERMMADIDRRGDWRSHPHDIVVLGSTVGRHISPFSSMYGSTKFGVNSLAEALRREVGPAGIRVSLIEPGIVKSEFQQVAGYDAEKFGALMEKMGPVLEPDDIARAINFICEQPSHVAIGDVVIRGTRQDYP